MRGTTRLWRRVQRLWLPRVGATCRCQLSGQAMGPRIIDGKAMANDVLRRIAGDVQQLKQDTGVTPRLAVVAVGESKSMMSYLRQKERACAKVGIAFALTHLPVTATKDDVITRTRDVALDPSVHGIIVQLPLPPHVHPLEAIAVIPPEKDVDGLHPANVGHMAWGRSLMVPCTPKGILHLMATARVPTAGRHIVIVGRSQIVGRPLATLLSTKLGSRSTVTNLHTETPNLSMYTRTADVVVTAAGVPALIGPDDVRVGVALIDVGINHVQDAQGRRHIVGDVHPFAVAKASMVTPVPGGVGPMTVAMLLDNTVEAVKRQLGIAVPPWDPWADADCGAVE